MTAMNVNWCCSFRNLEIGERFTFGSDSTFPDTCVKTGPRSYQTVDPVRHYNARGEIEWKPMRCKVGTVHVTVYSKLIEE